MKVVFGADIAIVKSYMVGISKDNGDNWVFINGSDSVKERLIRKHPELATTLIFPLRVMTTGGSTYSEVNGRWVSDEVTYREMKGTIEKLQNGAIPRRSLMRTHGRCCFFYYSLDQSLLADADQARQKSKKQTEIQAIQRVMWQVDGKWKSR